MGAWGTQVFENDASLDSLNFIRDSEDPFDFVKRAFSDCCSQEYLEVEEAGEALVCSYLLRGLEDRKYIEEDQASIADYTKNSIREILDKWQPNWDSEKTATIDGKAYFQLAIKALKRTLDPSVSEVSELWQETDSFDEWKKTVQAIIDDLEEIEKKNRL